MAKREDYKLPSERIDAEHPLGDLVPLGRFEWEQILLRCNFPQTSVKYVGLAVATWATTTTGSDVRPGLARLSSVTGLSDRPLRRYLKELERFGMLYKVASGSNFGRAGKGMASVYQLTAPESLALTFESESRMSVWAPDQQWDMESVLEQHSESSPTKEHRSPTTDDNQGSPVTHDRSYSKNTGRLELSPVVCDISPVVSSTITGRPRPPTSVLPPQESSPQLTNPQAASSVSQLTNAHANEKPATVVAEIVEDDGFTEFWKHYPRKVGKRKAETKYKAALKRASAQTINDAAKKLSEDPNLPEQRFIKYPTTWLEGDCWEDPAYERELTSSEKRMKQGFEVMQRAGQRNDWTGFHDNSPWNQSEEQAIWGDMARYKKPASVWDTPPKQISPEPIEDLGEQPTPAPRSEPTEEQQANYETARDALAWLPDAGVNLMAQIEAEHPEASIRQRVILAAQKLGQ